MVLSNERNSLAMAREKRSIKVNGVLFQGNNSVIFIFFPFHLQVSFLDNPTYKVSTKGKNIVEGFLLPGKQTGNQQKVYPLVNFESDGKTWMYTQSVGIFLESLCRILFVCNNLCILRTSYFL